MKMKHFSQSAKIAKTPNSFAGDGDITKLTDNKHQNALKVPYTRPRLNEPASVSSRFKDFLPSPLYQPYKTAKYEPIRPHLIPLNPPEFSPDGPCPEIHVTAACCPLVVDSWIENHRHKLFPTDGQRTFIGLDAEWVPMFEKRTVPHPISTIQVAVRSAAPNTSTKESDFDVLIVSMDANMPYKRRQGKKIPNPFTPTLLSLLQHKDVYKLGVGIASDVDLLGESALRCGWITQQQLDEMDNDVGNMVHSVIDLAVIQKHEWQEIQRHSTDEEKKEMQDAIKADKFALISKYPQKLQNFQEKQIKQLAAAQTLKAPMPLGTPVKTEDRILKPNMGLASLVTRYCTIQSDNVACLPKAKKIVRSFWAAWPLSSDQTQYAAMDAVAAIKIFECMKVDLSKFGWTEDKLIDIGKRPFGVSQVYTRRARTLIDPININELIQTKQQIIIVRKTPSKQQVPSKI
jgi:hypothetical protein